MLPFNFSTQEAEAIDLHGFQASQVYMERPSPKKKKKNQNKTIRKNLTNQTVIYSYFTTTKNKEACFFKIDFVVKTAELKII